MTPTLPWQRLDPRMLLVHPVRELVKFVPVLLGIVIAGSTSGFGWWALLGLGLPVGLGVVRYLTTTWRITDERVELRRGLLQRHTLSTPLDRVRTVDLTATLIHRVLDLETVLIGTGSTASSSDERLELDALPREQATALRTHLLQGRATTATDADRSTAPPPPPEHVVTRFSGRWLWYAPFSGTVLVAAGALAGATAQLAQSVDLRVSEDDLAGIDPAFALVLAAGALLLAIALAVTGYLVTNGGFVLARQGATWHVRRGLLTRRQTSIDVARMAGVSIAEPAALRLARGRKVNAIVTGLARDQVSSTVLLPPTPGELAGAVSSAVLGSDAPAGGPLRRHGRAAVTRRYTRALLGAAPIVVLVPAAAAEDVWAWGVAGAVLALIAALALATDRARSMGHGLLDGHVVARSGSVLRRREALAVDHVIGWNLRATWFQRRAGLVTVTATTAGGSGSVGVYDVPAADALVLAATATPGLLEDFLEESG